MRRVPGLAARFVLVWALGSGCFASHMRRADAAVATDSESRDLGVVAVDSTEPTSCRRYRRFTRMSVRPRIGRIGDGRIVIAGGTTALTAMFVEDEDPFSVGASERPIGELALLETRIATNANEAVALATLAPTGNPRGGSAFVRFGGSSPRVTVQSAGTLAALTLASNGTAFAPESRGTAVALTAARRFVPPRDAMETIDLAAHPSSPDTRGFASDVGLLETDSAPRMIVLTATFETAPELRLTRAPVAGGVVDRTVIVGRTTNPYFARALFVSPSATHVAFSEQGQTVRVHRYSPTLDLLDTDTFTLPPRTGRCIFSSFDDRVVLFCSGPPPEALPFAYDVALRRTIAVDAAHAGMNHAFEDVVMVARDRAIGVYTARPDELTAIGELCF